MACGADGEAFVDHEAELGWEFGEREEIGWRSGGHGGVVGRRGGM